MTTLINNLTPSDDSEIIGSRIGRIDPDNFRNQDTAKGGLLDSDDEEKEDTEIFDEPTDEDGDPTGEHDHVQDDNYSLGGHVTRSGSV